MVWVDGVQNLCTCTCTCTSTVPSSSHHETHHNLTAQFIHKTLLLSTTQPNTTPSPKPPSSSQPTPQPRDRKGGAIDYLPYPCTNKEKLSSAARSWRVIRTRPPRGCGAVWSARQRGMHGRERAAGEKRTGVFVVAGWPGLCAIGGMLWMCGCVGR